MRDKAMMKPLDYMVRRLLMKEAEGLAEAMSEVMKRDADKPQSLATSHLWYGVAQSIIAFLKAADELDKDAVWRLEQMSAVAGVSGALMIRPFDNLPKLAKKLEGIDEVSKGHVETFCSEMKGLLFGGIIEAVADMADMKMQVGKVEVDKDASPDEMAERVSEAVKGIVGSDADKKATRH